MVRTGFHEKYAHFLNPHGLGDLPGDSLFLLSYEKKEYLYHAGDLLHSLLILIEGRAKISTITEDGRTLLHSFVGPGQIVGETEMLTGDAKVRLFVQAVTPLQCIGIPLPESEKYLRENLDFMNRLAETLAQKLVTSNLQDARTILYPLETRLCSYIEMSCPTGHFEERLTQVCELLGTSYRHLHRTLEKLCREHVLEKQSRGYRILDREQLHKRGGSFYSDL